MASTQSLGLASGYSQTIGTLGACPHTGFLCPSGLPSQSKVPNPTFQQYTPREGT